jgi:integrative and conjugative element protein (TIGR02256 family)
MAAHPNLQDMQSPMIAPTQLRYVLPGSVSEIEFAAVVLSHFRRHRQLRMLSREAGGQMFADLSTAGVIKIVEATGPRKTDRRSLFSYHPDRTAERLEIVDRYQRGLHFVGDWHTHWQDFPVPSGTDNRSMKEMVCDSNHASPGFLMVIVGRTDSAEGLHVSYHTRTQKDRLQLAKATQDNPLPSPDQARV